MEYILIYEVSQTFSLDFFIYYIILKYFIKLNII